MSNEEHNKRLVERVKGAVNDFLTNFKVDEKEVTKAEEYANRLENMLWATASNGTQFSCTSTICPCHATWCVLISATIEDKIWTNICHVEEIEEHINDLDVIARFIIKTLEDQLVKNCND